MQIALPRKISKVCTRKQKDITKSKPKPLPCQYSVIQTVEATYTFLLYLSLYLPLSFFCYCSSSSRGLQLFTCFDAINALESRRRARVASRCRLRKGAGQGRPCDYAMNHPKKVVCACVGVCVGTCLCVFLKISRRFHFKSLLGN